MISGRLGLETARIPHSDRHGLMWLERGRLSIEDGNVIFATAGYAGLKEGVYQIPTQRISNIALGPGSSVTHDVLRVLSRQQTGIVFVGTHGVRLYASMPPSKDASAIARSHAELWTDSAQRIHVAKRMYAVRMGELLPQGDLNALRGVEGHRMKQIYRRLGEQYGIEWKGRKFDRLNPDKDDDINTAINHAATAVRSASEIAVALVGAIPQLGFIHEHSRIAFVLDIADLHRASLTLPTAFECTAKFQKSGGDLERLVRKEIGGALWRGKVVAEMIDQIKDILNVTNNRSDP